MTVTVTVRLGWRGPVFVSPEKGRNEAYLIRRLADTRPGRARARASRRGGASGQVGSSIDLNEIQ